MKKTSRVDRFGITRSSQNEVSDRQSVDKIKYRRATKHPKAKQNSLGQSCAASRSNINWEPLGTENMKTPGKLAKLL